jgi:hypothetical protein
VDEQHNSIRKNTYGSDGKPDRSKKASLSNHLIGRDDCWCGIALYFLAKPRRCLHDVL